jgi:hypothetical protein
MTFDGLVYVLTELFDLQDKVFSRLDRLLNIKDPPSSSMISWHSE